MLIFQIVSANAYAADVGYWDFNYRDATAIQAPTEDKTQSKLWFQDGSWWGVLYSPIAHGMSIYRLDAASQQWHDTGTVVDRRPTARADVLSDGQTLYVLSTTSVASEYGSPPNPDDVAAGSSQLSRYRYDPLSRSYSLDLGFPTTVHQGSTESTTLAKDSTGGLWSTSIRRCKHSSAALATPDCGCSSRSHGSSRKPKHPPTHRRRDACGPLNRMVTTCCCATSPSATDPPASR